MRSPSNEAYEETLSTLKYVERAKLIELNAVVNEDSNANIVKQLQSEIAQLKMQLSGKVGPDIVMVKKVEINQMRKVRTCGKQVYPWDAFFSPYSCIFYSKAHCFA